MNQFWYSAMLFLSSGTVDVTSKSTAAGQQHPGKTIYHISVVLNETQGDAVVPELGMTQITHNLAENSQPGGEIMNIIPLDRSPKLGRAQSELNRWPSQRCTGRAKEQRENIVEEESEEVVGKMKTDRFLHQPSKNIGNSSHQDGDVAEITAHSDTQEQHIRGSSLESVTGHAKGSFYGELNTGAIYSSLSGAVLRRACQDEARVDRKTVSMYGVSDKQPRNPQSDQERLSPRPRSMCMLAGPGPVLLEPRTHQAFKRAGVLENDQQYRSRKAELRAVDGLNPAVLQWPSAAVEVTSRIQQRSWKPRPVSMTVLELRKRGSDDEIDSQKSRSHTSSSGGGFLKGSFRWKLFGKAPQDKSKEREYDAKSSPKLSKSDAPKSTLGSLRRSLSLRIRRTRTRDKVNLGLETESKECFQTISTPEVATMPPRPFSYLTGRMLPPSSEQLEDGGIQYIHYHNKGKVKVMEVPFCPTKLSSKPVQEESPSIWQLIANRFRRKEQPFRGKCETQLSQSKSTHQYPLTRNNKSQPVTIETLTGPASHKGQGKTCEVAEFISQSSAHTPLLCTQLRCKRNTEGRFFFLEGQANEKHMGNCEVGWHSKMSGFGKPFWNFYFRFFSSLVIFMCELPVCNHSEHFF